MVLRITFFILSMLCTTVISSQCWEKVVSPDPASNDYFGRSVATDSLKTIIGAHQDDHSGVNDAGAVYIYDENNNYVSKVIASDAGWGDYFGYRVDSYASATINRFIVGAQRNDENGSNSGAAYVYDWNGSGWDEYKLMASDGVADDSFGGVVKISGDRAIVSAVGHDANGSLSGAAYIYEFDGSSWNEMQKILASDGNNVDLFSAGISILGDMAIVGTIEHDHEVGPPYNPGAVYINVWDGTSWVESQEFVPATVANGAEFGRGIDQDGDRIVIGAQNEGEGFVYLYDIDPSGNWLETKLSPTDLGSGDHFGDQVSIQGEQFVGTSNYANQAHRYDWNGTQWIYETLLAPNSEQGFGSGADVYKGRTVVGANYDDVGNFNTGSAFFYEWDQFFVDNDGDGYGNPDQYIYRCTMPATGYIDNDLDCDDNDPTITSVNSTCVLSNPCMINTIVQSDCTCVGTLDVNLNTFNNTLGNNLWNEAQNWSLTEVPDICHDVIIPAGQTAKILTGESGVCYKIEVKLNGDFIVEPGASFDAIVEEY